MIIFAQKHFSHKNAKAFSFLINLAIYFRAFLAVLSRFIKNTFLPSLDFLTIYLIYIFIEPIWENYKFGDSGQYPKEFLKYAVPSYIIVWLISIWLNGGYSKQIKFFNLIKGVGIGTVVILAIYALLPESLRFSRALILVGCAFTFMITYTNRFIVHHFKFFPQRFKRNRRLRIIVIGLIDETNRVEKIITKAEIKPLIIGRVSPSEETKNNYHIGTIKQLEEIVKVHRIDEVVFCAKNIPSNQIISNMLRLASFNLDYKIAQPDTFSIIGSNSIETAGELYTIEINSISNNENIRNKRTFDIISSVLILLFSPFILLFFKIPFKLINNSVHVLLGSKTWVGYKTESDVNAENLPKIKKGILTPLDLRSEKEQNVTFIHNANLAYAKNYKVWNDLNILLKGFKQIGR